VEREFAAIDGGLHGSTLVVDLLDKNNETLSTGQRFDMQGVCSDVL